MEYLTQHSVVQDQIKAVAATEMKSVAHRSALVLTELVEDIHITAIQLEYNAANQVLKNHPSRLVERPIVDITWQVIGSDFYLIMLSPRLMGQIYDAPMQCIARWKSIIKPLKMHVKPEKN